jgi:hypothetical protein
MQEFKPEEDEDIPDWIKRLQADGWEMIKAKKGTDGRIRTALFKKKESGS